MAVTIRMDNAVKEKSYEKLPRGVSMSALFRWALHAAIDNQREFEAACKADEAMMRVQRFMSERLKKIIE